MDSRMNGYVRISIHIRKIRNIQLDIQSDINRDILNRYRLHFHKDIEFESYPCGYVDILEDIRTDIHTDMIQVQ